MKFSRRLEKDSRVTILALSWRDIESPTAGGAEVHTHELLRRIDKRKFRLIHFASYYPREISEKEIDGVYYIRRGNIISVIWFAFLYYMKNRKNIDFVVEQCNTHRFFTPLWVNRKKRIFYIHQLTREIWDINLKTPWNKLGRILENTMLRLNRNDFTIALSPSTKKDLVDVGFKEDKIIIIPVGMSFHPWKKENMCVKESSPTFVYVGRYAYYKGIDIAIEAVGKVKEKYRDVKLWILGKKDEEYIENKLLPICRRYNMTWGDSESGADIVSWGFVSEEEKLELLSKSTALVFPSIREGWGIPITEAANVGTPSIVFDAPGIRDAVDYGRAGYLCDSNDVVGLTKEMSSVIENKGRYFQLKEQAYEFSSQFLWENSENMLEQFLEKIIKEEKKDEH